MPRQARHAKARQCYWTLGGERAVLPQPTYPKPYSSNSVDRVHLVVIQLVKERVEASIGGGGNRNHVSG